MRPLVSIIIPIFNREAFLYNTLSSIINQTYQNWELIIIDDGSTDNSLKIVAEFSKKDHRIKVFSRPENLKKGANVCRNFGFQKARGTYVNWFDSDDIMFPEFIQKKVKAFDESKDVDFVLSKTVKVYPNGERVYEKRTRMTENLLEDYIITKVSWYLPDGMFKRSCLNSDQLFNEEVMAGQDRDFYIRNMINCKVKIIDSYLTEYFYHERSISHSLYRTDNYKMKLSVFRSQMNQVSFLKENDLLTEKLRKYYFKEIKNKLPAVMKCNSLKKQYFAILYDLSGGFKDHFRPWMKIVTAYISFLVFGKGERLLK